MTSSRKLATKGRETRLAKSIFILVGALVGFGGILTTIFGCLFSSSTGSVALKFIMIPFLLCYLYNCTTLAFYISHMFISYLPETNNVLAYIHNGVKLILSIVITVIAAKIWEGFRNAAHCIRFSDCGEDEMILVHGLSNVTDLFCGPSLPDYSNDGCRRWLAQIPLIVLTIASMVIIHAVSQLWDDKFAPDIDPGRRNRVAMTKNNSAVTENSGPSTGNQTSRSSVDDLVYCPRCRKCVDCCPCDCNCGDRRTNMASENSRLFKSNKFQDGNYHHGKGISLEKVLRDAIRGD